MPHQFIELFQEFDCDRTRQRSATERRTVQPRLHAGGNLIGCEQGTQWQSSSQWFRNRDDIRPDSIVLIAKVLAGASQSALDFIQQQQRTRSFRQLACQRQKLMADRIDAAFALNGFDTNRTDAPIKLSLQFVDIVEWNEIHSGYQRLERIAILRLPGGRERAKCAPVERIFECQQTPLRLVSI